MPSDIIMNSNEVEVIGETTEFRKDGDLSTKPSVIVDAKNGNVSLGGNNTDGDLLIESKTGSRKIEISGGKNQDRDGRTVYINGSDPKIELTGTRARSNGAHPQLSITATSIECAIGNALPKFKITDRGAVFTTPITVIRNGQVTIDRDITINPGSGSETVNVHRDLVRLKKEMQQLKEEVADLRRQLAQN